jgi:uncharacterized protein
MMQDNTATSDLSQVAGLSISPSPRFVLKVSKYCNLRCDYCYEFPYLGDKARMSLEQIRRAFQNIQRSIEDLAIEDIKFHWHGGEPFLVPLEFYEQVALIQRDIFGAEFNYANTVQTNLTVLTDRHLDFLQRGFFESVGVSCDVYGDQRIDTKGKLRTDSVLANMQKLLDHNIEFGALAVLSRATLPKIQEIYCFFDERNIRHRVLAFYKTVSLEQTQRHELDFDDLVGAHKILFDSWLASEQATRVDPIDDYIHFAIRYLTGRNSDRYDRAKNEQTFLVGVNGDFFTNVECYEQEFCYGNMFHSSLSEILLSDARVRSINLSRDRTQRFCHQCPYFGSCPGTFVADATNVERVMLQKQGCPVRAVLDHVVDVLDRTDLTGLLARTYSESVSTSTMEGLALSEG